MVAGDHGHILRRTQALHPGQRVDVLLRQADVDEVARDGDVVGRLGLEVGDDALEHVHPVGIAAFAQPIHVAEQPFDIPIARSETGDGTQVHVREMRDDDRCHCLANVRHRVCGR